jgi:hypothetical protein
MVKGKNKAARMIRESNIVTVRDIVGPPWNYSKNIIAIKKARIKAGF